MRWESGKIDLGLGDYCCGSNEAAYVLSQSYVNQSCLYAVRIQTPRL